MERNKGLRGILQNPFIYDTFQRIVGGRRSGIWLCEHHWKIAPGMIVVDVGCGPARIRDSFPPEIEYFGFDPNPAYIKSAREKRQGTFFEGVMAGFLESYGEDLLGRVDIVVCSGILHHLSTQEMNEVLRGSAELLKSGGRFVAIEPTYLEKQDLLSRWVLNQDRGTNILLHTEWDAALREFFEKVEVRVVNQLTRIPYVHGLLTGWKM